MTQQVPTPLLTAENQPLWTPAPELAGQTQLAEFMRRVGQQDFPDYHSLWEWSVKNPGAFLERIYRLGASQSVFSFPIRWTLRTPTRWLRLNMNNCPVYFYGKSQVDGLLRQAGWTSVEIHSLSRDYLAQLSS